MNIMGMGVKKSNTDFHTERSFASKNDLGSKDNNYDFR